MAEWILRVPNTAVIAASHRCVSTGSNRTRVHNDHRSADVWVCVCWEKKRTSKVVERTSVCDDKSLVVHFKPSPPEVSGCSARPRLQYCVTA